MTLLRRPGGVGVWGIWLAPLLAACSFDLGTNGFKDAIDKASDEWENIKVCDGMTLGELVDAQTLSDDCKQQVESYLPQAENDFKGRLIVLGQQEGEDGSLALYVHGVDAKGEAISAKAFSELSVTASIDGETVTLESEDITTRAGENLTGDLLSIAFVNDYSGSMSEADLSVTAEIESDLIGVLPDIFEGEVTLFSTEVETRLTFTEERDDLLDAVSVDETFTRDLTALYDGMGVGLDSLIERKRPIRLLVVATDGQENESKTYVKSQLLQTIGEHEVCVLMLGSLFSDPDELRGFTGSCGAYFYTPSYGDLKSAVMAYVDSLRGLTQLTIPAELRGEGKIELKWGEFTTEID